MGSATTTYVTMDTSVLYMNVYVVASDPLLFHFQSSVRQPIMCHISNNSGSLELPFRLDVQAYRLAVHLGKRRDTPALNH